MIGSYGSFEYSSTEFQTPSPPLSKKYIALLGDTSNHGGTIIDANQDGTYLVGGIEVAVEDALHSCPLPGHGITAITPITIKTYHNGKLIITYGAVAGCGAIILPIDRNVYIE